MSTNRIKYRTKRAACKSATRKACPRHARRWTDNETEKLRQLYADHSLLELARLFDREQSAIRSKATKMGLHKYPVERAERPIRSKRTRIEGESDDTRSKYGCMPNPLIFLEGGNWVNKARQIRDHESKGVYADRHHHWGTFVVGRMGGFDD